MPGFQPIEGSCSPFPPKKHANLNDLTAQPRYSTTSLHAHIYYIRACILHIILFWCLVFKKSTEAKLQCRAVSRCHQMLVLLRCSFLIHSVDGQHAAICKDHFMAKNSWGKWESAHKALRYPTKTEFHKIKLKKKMHERHFEIEATDERDAGLSSPCLTR